MGKSHFPIDLGILTAIRQLAKPDSTIVELGSGNGTNRLGAEYTVYSIEDDEKWVGYCEGSNYIHAPLIDLDYSEDSNADTDMNVVMVEDGGFIEIQGTAEQEPFRRESLDTMLELAERSIKDLEGDVLSIVEKKSSSFNIQIGELVKLQEKTNFIQQLKTMSSS